MSAPKPELGIYLESLHNYFRSGHPYADIRVRIPQQEVLLNVMRSRGGCLLVGPPGTGKTSLLDFLALEGSSKEVAIPVYVPLRRYAGDLRVLLDHSIDRFRSGYGWGALLEDAKAAENVPVWLLFDGLDDVFAGHRWDVVEEVGQLAASNDWGVAASARDDVQHASFRRFTRVSLTPLELPSIRSTVEGGERGEELWTAIQQSPKLAELASHPLMLATLVQQWEAVGDVDDNLISRAAMYTGWRGHTKSGLSQHVEPEVVDSLFRQLALRSVIADKRWFPRTLVREIAETLSPDEYGAVEEVAIAADPLVVEDEEVRFRHDSYQTSYAASALLHLEGAALRAALAGVTQSSQGTAVLEDLLNSAPRRQLVRLLRELSEDFVEEWAKAAPESFAARVLELADAASGIQSSSALLRRVERFVQSRRGRSRNILVISVHGFNTRGVWKDRLTLLLSRETDGDRYVHSPWDYGDFRLGLFNPFARRRCVNSFQVFYNDLMDRCRSERALVCCVAHSFGTYIVGNALRRFPEVRFDRLLCLGSVLPGNFDWEHVHPQCPQVLNMCGGKDRALRLARFVPGLGTAGLQGFTRGKQVVDLRLRYSDHSDVFGYEFMRKRWVPFFRDGTIVGAGTDPVRE